MDQETKKDFEVCPIGTIELLRAAQEYIKLSEMRGVQSGALQVKREHYHRVLDKYRDLQQAVLNGKV